MIEGRTVVGLITARGGSLGVPRKNLREVGGRSLIARAVDAALAAETVDRVVLSSDDPEIIQAAMLAGCDVPFVRPAELATPEATSMAVVHHALDSLDQRYDLVVLLQPTSPFRTAADIDGAVRHCLATAAPACVSVTVPDKSPHWCYRLDESGRMVPLMKGLIPSRRQDLPPAYAVNGAVYVAYCRWLLARDEFVQPETVAYPMPKARSIDIDDELDLAIAAALADKGLVEDADARQVEAPAALCRAAAG